MTEDLAVCLPVLNRAAKRHLDGALPNNVSALVTRLTAAGLLERRQDEGDKRVVRLRVTLVGAAGNVVASAVTGADGGYAFTDLDGHDIEPAHPGE